MPSKHRNFLLSVLIRRVLIPGTPDIFGTSMGSDMSCEYVRRTRGIGKGSPVGILRTRSPYGLLPRK